MSLLHNFDATSSVENLDEFNYDETVKHAGITSYGPTEWDQVSCSDLQACRGWPDAWEMALDWELKENGW